MDLFSDLPDPDRAEVNVSCSSVTSTTNNNTHQTEQDRLHEQVVPSTESNKKTPEERKRKLECAIARKEDASTDKKAMKLEHGIHKLKGHMKEMKGEREEMQDAHVIIDDMTSQFDSLPSSISRIAYYAVFDGHGGARASTFAASKLHSHIIQKFPKTDVTSLDKEVKRCLIDSFKLTDEQFLKEASAQKPIWKDGSTAICILVVDSALYIANLGDISLICAGRAFENTGPYLKNARSPETCLALLCRYNEDSKVDHFLPLSRDHSPTQYEERIRIQKAGGKVTDGRIMGILEVSRSIGDGRFKHCGVTCIPDVKKCLLTDKDKFLLLACDGLWKGFTIEGALEFINNILKTDDTGDNKTENIDAKLEVACSRLAAEAIRRGSSDNVTVMLVSITT